MDIMENPWRDLRPSEDSYVLEMDRQCITQHNEIVGEKKTRFIVGSIPEPFIGNHDSPRVVLLGKNPGHAAQVKKDHSDANFQMAIFRNLRHEPQEYPFYPMNPSFKKTGAGIWWRAHTRELQDDLGANYEVTLGKWLLAIEWFPYPSERFARPKIECGSQKYSFQLAKRMLDKNVLFVGMRGKREWAEVDPRFEQVPFLNSPQNVCLSRGNTKNGLYARIMNALQGSQ
jgi:hypothetical protein